jgi:hypothetical protein
MYPFVILILLFSTVQAENILLKDPIYLINETAPGSIRNSIEDMVIIPDNNPFFGIIGSYIACWYDKCINFSGLIPLLVQNHEILTSHHEQFLNQYLKSHEKTVLILGNHVSATYNTTEFLGSPPEVALSVAKHVFSTAPTVMIIPYNVSDAYTLSLIASPLASYLNIPILIYNKNDFELQSVCTYLNTTHAYIVGNIQVTLQDITLIRLQTIEKIQHVILSTISELFKEIKYITLTNPSDTIAPYSLSSYETNISDHITNIKVTLLSNEIDIVGTGFNHYTIKVPEGITNVNIYGHIHTRYDSRLINPILFLYLYDPQGNIVAYSNSLAYDIGETYVETLTCNAPGNYSLYVYVYNGIKGGYFSQRGLSIVNTDIELSIDISKLEKPHMPLIPHLSLLAPYLTSAHGGIIGADTSFELTDEGYISNADGCGTGPWYTEKLHTFNNEKVNYTLNRLKATLALLDYHNLLDGYLDGPAWLALLADTNMIPMYYYGPSQQELPEKGLPSDNPYALKWNLSVGRVIGWNVQDVSLLISRTLFYQEICEEPTTTKEWHNRFSFVFGEGFGETGGIFHQIPYAHEIKQYGFDSRVFGNLRNSRQLASLLNTYIGSNYIEYLGHADWFWFQPSFYGLDYYSKALDVAHVKHWIFTKPSIFLSSACLMGRVDGIPPQMNIGLTILHAGINCFLGATRETGSEAGLTIFENHLIVDDFSVGEALRGEKRVDKELPTYLVRTVYGDPAFNPYEPNNGFSRQGRPAFQY